MSVLNMLAFLAFALAAAAALVSAYSAGARELSLAGLALTLAVLLFILGLVLVVTDA